MFVLTLSRKNTRRLLAGFLAVTAIVAAGAGIKNFIMKDERTARITSSIKLTTTQEMADYVLAKGYTVDMQSATVKEVKIPKKFDAEFENFNGKINRTDGLSLEKYKNDKVNKWTFDIVDYGVEGKSASAVLLLKKDKLIGAYLLEMPDGTACPLAKSAGQGDILQ
ncbi:MAG: DUF4830 domain-containing protein [Oscillospiraceae bacterium]|nr:DUF4830 domain-containing protein [Oscillospiraceae bacterium]